MAHAMLLKSFLPFVVGLPVFVLTIIRVIQYIYAWKPVRFDNKAITPFLLLKVYAWLNITRLINRLRFQQLINISGEK